MHKLKSSKQLLAANHNKNGPSKRYSQPDNEVAAIEPEVADRYFGDDSKLAFAETYRQLKRQGEIYAGGYEELHTVITGPAEKNAIFTSILEMESCGVLTPRIVSGVNDADSQVSSLTVDPDVRSTASSHNRNYYPGGQGYAAAKQLHKEKGSTTSHGRPKSRNFRLQSGEEDGDTFITKVDSEVSFGVNQNSTDNEAEHSNSVAGKRIDQSNGLKPITEEAAAEAATETDVSAAGTLEPTAAVIDESAPPRKIGDGEESTLGSLDFGAAGIGGGLEYNSEDEDDLATVQTYSAASPRAIFINGCLREKVPPITLALIRKNITTTVNLAHMGIGDKIAHILAQCLSSLPYLQKLILSDNNLEDEGLAALIRSASKHKDIEVLDISSNIIGFDSATALGDYLGNPECKLKCLRMRDANIDDVECAHMVSVLMHNTHLQEFDLSKNILGKDENLNVVKPSFVTGGESLAALLLHSNCPLEKLILHWNMIRLDGAVALCEAIQTNKVLTHLDLSYNAVASAGAEVLGRALMENNVLRHLNLSHNNIESIGCFTLCSGIAENKSLETLLLDGNPLGELGGRMLAKITASASLQLNISALGCDLTIRTRGAVKYDMNDPFGEYDLQLDSPYDRAVLMESLRFVAENPTATIQELEIRDARDQTEIIPLVRVECERDDLTDAELRDVQEYEALCQLNEIHESFILSSLQKYDVEGLEQVPTSAIDSILYEFNVEVGDDTVAEIRGALDPFDSRFVDVQVLAQYLKRRGQNAVYQLQNIKRKYFMVTADEARASTSSSSAAGKSRPTTSSIRMYTPPAKGRMKMAVTESSGEGLDAAAMKKHALPRINARRVIEAAENSSNSLSIITSALETCGLYLEEALTFFNHIYSKTDDAVGAVTKLLPQMVSADDGKQLVKNCLGYDMQKLRRLKQKLGSIYYPLVAIYSGYYQIDFSISLDRRCWKMLLTRSTDISNSRTRKGLGELSQHGDGVFCFRNVFERSKVPGGKDSIFSLSTIPKSGKIEFDFIDCVTVDSTRVHPMTDEAMVQILHMSCLLDDSDLDIAMEKLTELLRAARKTILTAGNPHWKADFAHAASVGKHLNNLYRSLPSRLNSLESISKRETLDKEDENDPQRTFQRKPTSMRLRTQTLERKATKLAIQFVEKFDHLLEKRSHIVHLVSKTAWITRIRKIMKDFRTAAEFKSMHLLEFFTMELRNMWLFCRQIALLVELFEVGTAAHSKFGSYRVQLIVMMFDRIVDLHNFNFILKYLTAEEQAAIYARIGVLNIFNPATPEGAIQLDLSRWDERQIVKLLIHLSCVEPGENWRNEQYSFERQMPPIPGWELKVTWFTSDGLPTKGVLTVEVYSGEGMNLRDCLLDRTLRNMMHSVVLVPQRNIAREIEQDLAAPTSAFNSRITTPLKNYHWGNQQKPVDQIGGSIEPASSMLGTVPKKKLSIRTEPTSVHLIDNSVGNSDRMEGSQSASNRAKTPLGVVHGLEDVMMKSVDSEEADSCKDGNIISSAELDGLRAQKDIFKLLAVPAEVALASSYTYRGGGNADSSLSSSRSPPPTSRSQKVSPMVKRTGISPKGASPPPAAHDRFGIQPVTMNGAQINSVSTVVIPFRQYTLTDLHQQLREKTEITWTYQAEQLQQRYANPTEEES